MTPAPNSERVLFTSPAGLRVGSFRRYPWHRDFADSGPTGGFLLVFPRTSVVIQHAGAAPVVADLTRVMLYNRGQEYRRRALTERGDECEWFSFPPALIAEAMHAHDPAAGDRLDRPFTASHASVDAQTYLLQRRIVEHAADPLFVEEAMLQLLERCVGRPVAARSRHRELAEACRTVLSRRIAEPLSLFELAARVGASAFHLSRVFRAETGFTLHAYLHELRLRTALERVRDGEDLSRVALDLGYTSHSHFTARFRRLFGATPSRLRTRS